MRIIVCALIPLLEIISPTLKLPTETNVRVIFERKKSFEIIKIYKYFFFLTCNGHEKFYKTPENLNFYTTLKSKDYKIF